MTAQIPKGIGNKIAPPRFIAFALIAAIVTPIAIALTSVRIGCMIGFDVAASVFLASCFPLISGSEVNDIRDAAQRNDANRGVLLGIVGVVTLVILVVVASELSQKKTPDGSAVGLIILTLVLSWVFSNLIYALHYAHLFYSRNEDGSDDGGIGFPKTNEPAYWDFIYFAFTLGMTFQTSDTSIEDTHIRKIVTFHCLAAFIFNIGVLAFTINVLGGG